MRFNMKQYLRNLRIALSQLLNAVLLGDPDETLSARLGRAAMRGSKWGRWLYVALNWAQPDHCEKAARGDGGKECS